MSTSTPIDEVAWQTKWNDARIFETELSGERPKFYCLEMYPYPSGKMHMGHVRNYSIGDAVARYKRMKGFDVLYPMGFDSFGMPAENAAIKEGGHPHDITERNMHSIIKQIQRMGFSYDWRRMVKSHDPNYYKWNQWFFTKFFEKGLAYQQFAPVNWCEACTTVLANEQVKAGRCWRCNGPVLQRDMSQWFLDLPAYAQELLDGLEDIVFPENVRLLQQDWLGRSEGANITFDIEGGLGEIEVYTTRPDTLFGATFVTLAPEHPLAPQLVVGTEVEDQWKALHDEVSTMSEFDRIKNMKKKEGFFSGHYAIHPLTAEKIPIWFGNFVIASYGTGAVMAVPAHDQRDFEFASMYNIPIRRVLVPEPSMSTLDEMKQADEALGFMVNSPLDGFDGLYGQEAKQAVIQALEQQERGHRTINWKIRPWLISRQRYWGTPIPIIHCDTCGAVPVPEQDLPVLLPNDVVFGQGNPLETSHSFVHASCPSCGKDARRETDTMDTFVDSSWYFFRYTDAKNNDVPFHADIANSWMNVDFYCGGIEHAQMHLIYARFWTKAVRDLGLHSIAEPFQELVCQGMVNKSAPFCETCNLTLSVDHEGQPCPHCQGELSKRSAKMSKSLGNTVSPEDMIEQYGADTVRLFILFAANPTAGMDWSDTALEANHRVILQLCQMPETIDKWGHEPSLMDDWLNIRMEQRIEEFCRAMDSYDLRRAVEISHYDIPKDINWYKRRGGNNLEVGHRLLKKWAQLIAVSTPHLAEEWWKTLGGRDFVSTSSMDDASSIGPTEMNILRQEQYLRDILENARKVKSIAERHLDAEPQRVHIHFPQQWKIELAKFALRYIDEGGNVKNIINDIKQQAFVTASNVGAVLGFWSKKMLPQLFKWTDEEKLYIQDGFDEYSALEQRLSFMAQELRLQEVLLVAPDSGVDDSKSNAAMPLQPSLLYE
ncbi:MAG: leucine--tRNA ligase [Candidatus Poseidoniales archaeon]